MSIAIPSLFEKIAPKRRRKPLAAGRAYFCRCGRPVFFRNSICLACNTPLGFEPYQQRVFPLDPGPEEGTWLVAREGAAVENQATGTYLRCPNLEKAGCNWLVSEAEAKGNPRLLCIACRLNRTIPILRWPRMASCGPPGIGQTAGGFLAAGAASAGGIARRSGYRTWVGIRFFAVAGRRAARADRHDNGIITINIEEADDAARERMREQMHEPYRTCWAT